MSDIEDRSLISLPDGSLTNTAAGTDRILSVMIEETLALARDAAVGRVDFDALVREGKSIYSNNGDEMTEENIRAFGLFHRAAEAGHGEAQHLIYKCYLYGHGVKNDVVKCLEWLHKAARSGFAEAQYGLGSTYRDGMGVAQDYTEAAKWFWRAAAQGHVNAQSELASCYVEGEGVPKDYVEAVKWFRKAAEQGNATSQHNLALMYANGEGVSQDYSEAAKWYHLAAEQGYAGSENNLGLLFEHGDGVTQDYAAAVEWYRRAVNGGDEIALFNLNKLTSAIELENYEKIVFAFSDLMDSHSPLIGDCAMLPHSKETILYAMKFVVDAYETECELTTNRTLANNCAELIEVINYHFTSLARDWQDIAPEDKDTVARLAECDSFPDWALPLKLKYIDEKRARSEAFDAKLQFMKDKVAREKRRSVEADGR